MAWFNTAIPDEFSALGITVEEPKRQFQGIDETVDLVKSQPTQSANQYMIDNYFTPSAEVVQAVADDDEKIRKQEDMKQVWADEGISPTVDTANKYRSSSTGFEYNVVDGSKGKLIANAMLGYITNYLQAGGADSAQAIGAGALGAYNMYRNQEDMAHRFGQIDYLESKGYNPTDISDYIQTGNREALVANKGKWQAAGAGIIFNPTTGEYKRLTGAGGTSGRIIDKTVDLGDRVLIQYADGTKEEQPKGDKPSNSSDFQVIPGTGYRFNKRTGESSPIPQSGGIGLDSEFAEDGVGGSGLVERDGVFYEPKKDKLGNTFYEVAKNQKVLKESRDANRPTASDTQVYDITQRITSASDSDLSPITGYGAQFIGDTGRSVVSRLAPGETNALRLDIENMKQTMTNAAVQMATKAGQSGINIQSEVDRLAKAFDRMDYSSPEALRRSVAETEALYANLSRTYKEKVIDSGTPVKEEKGSSGSYSYADKYGF